MGWYFHPIFHFLQYLASKWLLVTTNTTLRCNFWPWIRIHYQIWAHSAYWGDIPYIWFSKSSRQIQGNSMYNDLSRCVRDIVIELFAVNMIFWSFFHLWTISYSIKRDVRSEIYFYWNVSTCPGRCFVETCWNIPIKLIVVSKSRVFWYSEWPHISVFLQKVVRCNKFVLCITKMSFRKWYCILQMHNFFAFYSNNDVFGQNIKETHHAKTQLNI